MRWATPAERSPARIFLVGFMGSGKTTVGRLLARTMNLRFIDLDRRIEEAAGRGVARIFELEGEAGFRARERRALEEAAAETGVVVAAGGGVMASAANRELLAAHATTVWLDPDFDTLVRRVEAQPEVERPLFVDRGQARRLYASRLAGYRQADLRVDVGAGEGAAAVADRIASLLEEGRCAT